MVASGADSEIRIMPSVKMRRQHTSTSSFLSTSSLEGMNGLGPGKKKSGISFTPSACEQIEYRKSMRIYVNALR